MADDKAPLAEPSYVLVARDYADIVHLENPNVIERILSSSRSEKVAYVSALMTSGLSRLVVAGPKVAFAAMTTEALTDLGREVSEWIKDRKIPEDFSGRSSGYQTWVELLQEIDSNPVDAERLKAMKAMFLAANRVNATDGESILAYQLFRIAKDLTSGQLLLLKSSYERLGSPAIQGAERWLVLMASRLGHNIREIVEQDERVLMEYRLLSQRRPDNVGQSNFGAAPKIEDGIDDSSGRLTTLGLKFCENIRNYQTSG